MILAGKCCLQLLLHYSCTTTTQRLSGVGSYPLSYQSLPTHVEVVTKNILPGKPKDSTRQGGIIFWLRGNLWDVLDISPEIALMINDDNDQICIKI